MKTNRKHNDLQIESLEPMVLMSASAADVEGDDTANALVGQTGDTVNGAGGDDLISGIRDNGLCGGDGDDLLITGEGYNTIDGGEGADTIKYATFNRADVSILFKTDGSVEISDGNKIDVINNVETFEFKDQILSLADLQADANNAPVIETGDHLTIAENQTEVATIVASDADGEGLVFSLSDAQDGALFEIDSDTGVLSFKVAPDFESPNSVNGTNVYDVTVRVSDCNTTTLKTFWVTVTDVDENGGGNNPPTFDNLTDNEVIEVNEGTIDVRDINATDLDGDNITFSFSDGINTPGDGPNQDPGRFDLDPATGELSFKVAPDFEDPADADGDNEYLVTVVISDGQSAVERDITIRVLDVDENSGGNNPPTFDNLTDNEVIEVNEGTIDVRDINATDLDGDNITFSFSDGINTPGDGPNQDPGRFNLDPDTGELSFKVAPDFEDPADADEDNEYLVTVVISDGQSAVERDITIRVLDVDENSNQAPSFTNVEEGVIVTVPENETYVGDANGSDPDGDAVIYSIAGGDDANLFQVDPTTGVVTFKAAPDFEAPQDANGDNDYNIVLRISDGSLFQDRSVTVKVLDRYEGGNNNAPYFTNVEQNEQVTVVEGNTHVGDADGTDPDGDNVTYSIIGGDDSGRFNIDAATGVVTFKAAPDFENPTDADGNNVYALTLRISDGSLFQDRDVTVKVLDRYEGGNNNAPYFTNVEQNEQVTVVEGNTHVGDADGTDPDGDNVTYSIIGGDDSGRFNIDAATGVVTFKAAPDFENPTDADGNNVYALTLRISDGSLFQDRDVTVKVLDRYEGGNNNAPYFTNVEQNEQVTVVEGNTHVGDADGTDPDGDNVTYSIVGGDDSGRFNIDAATGVVTFKAAPDFENPTDADGNNVYALTLRISDGSLFQDRDVTVKVLDRYEGGNNNAPYFTNVEQNEVVWHYENHTHVGDADAYDADGDTLTFSIAGGADSNFFQINAQTGQLCFIHAPDFEDPQDADGNNRYVVILRVSDGAAFEDRKVIVNVEDLTNA